MKIEIFFGRKIVHQSYYEQSCAFVHSISIWHLCLLFYCLTAGQGKWNAAKRPIWLLELGVEQDGTPGSVSGLCRLEKGGWLWVWWCCREGWLAVSAVMLLSLLLWLAGLCEGHLFLLVLPDQKKDAHSTIAEGSPRFLYQASQSCLSHYSFWQIWHFGFTHLASFHRISHFSTCDYQTFSYQKDSIWSSLSKWDWSMFYCCGREVQDKMSRWDFKLMAATLVLVLKHLLKDEDATKKEVKVSIRKCSRAITESMECRDMIRNIAHRKNKDKMWQKLEPGKRTLGRHSGENMRQLISPK